VQQALFQYQKTLLEAFEEVEGAIAAFHFAVEKKAYLEKMKELNQREYHLTQQLYEVGIKNYLDVQNGERRLLRAESAYLQSEEDLLIQYIVLYKALGGAQFEIKMCFSQ
jgi:outer membrane protein TolC